MAQPASDSWVRRLLALLAYAPGRLEFALRLALASTLTTAIAVYYGLPEAALAAYLVFFINRPDRLTSIAQAVALTVVGSSVIALILLMARSVLDFPALRLGSMVLVSVVLLYLASASRLRTVGATIALAIAYGLDLLGSAVSGELVTRALLYGWLLVGVPAGVCIAVNAALGPAPRRLLQHGLAARLRTCAAVLRRQQPCAAITNSLQTDDAPLHQALAMAEREHTSPTADVQALRSAFDASVVVLSAVQALEQAPAQALPQAHAEVLADTMEHMASAFQQGGYPVDVQVQLPAQPALQAAQADIVAVLCHALQHFAEPDPSRAAPVAPIAPTAKAGFFLPDAFTNGAHLRYALTTTLAAMLCYALYSLLHWPGIHTCMLTCYVVSLGTLGESVEKLVLRLVGCLVGAAMGVTTMLLLMPSVTTLLPFLCVVFAGALAAGWVAVGHARIAYMGLQMALAFFLCVVQGSGPGFDLVVVRDRVIDILLGNLVSYAVAYYLRPQSLGERVEQGLQEALRQLQSLAQQMYWGVPPAALGHLQAAVGEINNDLVRIHYEPALIRPTPAWLHAHDAKARRIHDASVVLAVLAQLPRHTRCVSPWFDVLQSHLSDLKAPPRQGSHEVT